MKRITDAQLRAARALIRWSALELAQAAGIGVATVLRAEKKPGPIGANAANEAAMRNALERAGVEFIAENESGPGVRLRKAAVPPTVGAPASDEPRIEAAR